MIKEIGITKLLIIGACGIILVALPTEKSIKNKEVVNNITKNDNQDKYVEELEDKLENLLRNVNGVGNVKVMITLNSSSESVVLSEKNNSSSSENSDKNENINASKESRNYEENVIFSEDSKGNKIPYVTREDNPKICGVAVVCEGGDNPGTVYKISEMIKALFDIPMNKISVIGMG